MHRFDFLDRREQIGRGSRRRGVCFTGDVLVMRKTGQMGVVRSIIVTENQATVSALVVYVTLGASVPRPGAYSPGSQSTLTSNREM